MTTPNRYEVARNAPPIPLPKSFLGRFALLERSFIDGLFIGNIRREGAAPEEIVAWVQRDCQSYLSDGLASREIQRALLRLQDLMDSEPGAVLRFAGLMAQVCETGGAKR